MKKTKPSKQNCVHTRVDGHENNNGLTLSAFIKMIGYGKFFNTLTRPHFRVAHRAKEATFVCGYTFIAKLFTPSAGIVCGGNEKKKT